MRMCACAGLQRRVHGQAFFKAQYPFPDIYKELFGTGVNKLRTGLELYYVAHRANTATDVMLLKSPHTSAPTAFINEGEMFGAQQQRRERHHSLCAATAVSQLKWSETLLGLVVIWILHQLRSFEARICSPVPGEDEGLGSDHNQRFPGYS
ncbi:hypothetical protein NDU88_001337 [Pleurodeles waltl]|uniref:Uncharacterized protein n=1 Tax=Pleurodeles waltl TaxID=8319 RepID=A0AAV7U7A4_PLEWA|nr:hypothetical protein NDU88_001337 [Pleurodeles waltl]